MLFDGELPMISMEKHNTIYLWLQNIAKPCVLLKFSFSIGELPVVVIC